MRFVPSIAHGHRSAPYHPNDLQHGSGYQRSSKSDDIPRKERANENFKGRRSAGVGRGEFRFEVWNRAAFSGFAVRCWRGMKGGGAAVPKGDSRED